MNEIIGACPHDCPDTCSLITQVDNGIAISVKGNPKHAQTAGVICNKVSKYPQRTYAQDRLTQPLKRVGPKGARAQGAAFEVVSWERAIADIASRLRAIAARDPRQILPYSYAGTMGRVQGESMSSRFFNKLGASQLERTICSSAGTQALTYCMGAKVGMRVEGFAKSKLIIIWGSNSVTSNLHFWRYANQAKAAGAKLICIDPRRTETAEKCHMHLRIKPGTDSALAFAVMRELIVNNALDHEYIASYTTGWEQLRERAMLWSVERAAAVCGLAAAQIIELAHLYGAEKHSAIRLNYGMQRSRGGGNAVWAVMCLPALTGAWRSEAGGALLANSGRFAVDLKSLQRPDLMSASPVSKVNMSTIGDALAIKESEHSVATPHIKAVIVYNSNPLAVAPDSSRVAAGFAREDLFTVVLEHFQTDTADYADYVLPATTQLEHWDIHTSYGHTDILLNQPAISPVGESKPNTQIFRELAWAMGYTDECFTDDDQTLCEMAFKATIPNLSFEELKRTGYYALDLPAAPYANGQFHTPSRRFEFYCDAREKRGEDPMPEYIPNYEQATLNPDYPLAMISPPARNFLNSTFVNIDAIHKDKDREPFIELHPEDAQRRHIAQGSKVEVYNERGRYQCTARITENTQAGMVVGLGVWWRKNGLNGTNVNELTSQKLTDMGQGPTFYDCAVEVRALHENAL